MILTAVLSEEVAGYPCFAHRRQLAGRPVIRESPLLMVPMISYCGFLIYRKVTIKGRLAGASTAEWAVDKVIKRLEEMSQATTP